MQSKHTKKETPYQLVGFTSPLGTGPCFFIPVYCKEEKLFVQGKKNSKGHLSAFEECGSNIELNLHEGAYLNTDENRHSVGKPYQYCIQEENGSIVLGDKDYVSKYLKQNMKKFVTKPHFLSSALEFCDYKIAEAFFIEDYKDIIEARFISKSIKKYYKENDIELELDNSTIEKNSYDLLVHWSEYAERQAEYTIKYKKFTNFKKQIKEIIFQNILKDNALVNLYEVFSFVSNVGIKKEESHFYWSEKINKIIRKRHVFSSAIELLLFYQEIPSSQIEKLSTYPVNPSHENKKHLQEYILKNIKNTTIEKESLTIMSMCSFVALNFIINFYEKTEKNKKVGNAIEEFSLNMDKNTSES